MTYRTFILAAVITTLAGAAHADTSFLCNGRQIGIYIDSGRVLVRRDNSAPFGQRITSQSPSQIVWHDGTLTIDGDHIVYHDEFTMKTATCVRSNGDPSNF
jgi:hypothetical protein